MSLINLFSTTKHPKNLVSMYGARNLLQLIVVKINEYDDHSLSQYINVVLKQHIKNIEEKTSRKIHSKSN